MPKNVCLEHMQDFTEDILKAKLKQHGFEYVHTEKVVCGGWEFILAFCEQ
jgi:hypothetical protein